MSTCTEGCFRNVINLGNSIIGVSILAMPYCFQKCGILLSIVLIMASGLMTKASCHLLLKAAIMARRRNFEFLAFHTFGTLGKFAVELSIIGFLLGTCIAFFVVVGDLSPPLAAEFFLIESTARLRVEVLLVVGFFIALPLGLLRKVESLTSFSFISVCFYIFLCLKILGESLPNISSEILWNKLHWWRPSGLLSTLPIFFMALSCQTQLFEIFDTLNDPSLKRMDTVVSSAVHMCSAVYSLVGTFGYIAFYDQNISGNVLMKLSNSGLTEVVKIAFVVSVVISFPLCLFPCRSSLHSLIYKQGVSLHEIPGVLMIPDHRFRILTFSLVAATISAAILLPDIEFVLGILGSTIGTIICFILPALIFIKNTMKNTNERILAQVVFCIGVFILVACSYSTLHETKVTEDTLPEEPLPSPMIPQQRPKPFLPKLDGDAPVDQQFMKAKGVVENLNEANHVQPVKNDFPQNPDIKDVPVPASPVSNDIKPAQEKRQEPPIPQEPEDTKKEEIKKKVEMPVLQEDLVEQKKVVVPEQGDAEPKVNIAQEKMVTEPSPDNSQNDLHPDAIKKEEKEIEKKRSKEEKKNLEEIRKAEKQEQLLLQIEAQQKEQKKLLEEQRQLLQELKEHKESHSIKSSPVPPPAPPQQEQQKPQVPAEVAPQEADAKPKRQSDNNNNNDDRPANVKPKPLDDSPKNQQVNEPAKPVNIPKFLPQVTPKAVPVPELNPPKLVPKGDAADLKNPPPIKKPLTAESKENMNNKLENLPAQQNSIDEQPRFNASVDILPVNPKISDRIAIDPAKNVIPNFNSGKDGM